MKHKLTVAACVIALAGVGTATVTSYQDHQNEVRVQRAQATAASEVKAEQATAQKAKFNVELKKLETLCVQQKTAYATLTAAEKARTVAPDCNASVVAP